MAAAPVETAEVRRGAARLTVLRGWKRSYTSKLLDFLGGFYHENHEAPGLGFHFFLFFF